MAVRSAASVERTRTARAHAHTHAMLRLLTSFSRARFRTGYWMHELSYTSLESNDSGYTQQPWLPDELCGYCMLCNQRFHLWRWTHHCRDCGG